MVDFRILGSLEALDGERAIPLGGGRQRGVLAVLLIHRGKVVSVDRIVDLLWGARPPDSAAKTVQVYVSRLRKALGEGLLLTRGGGYVLELVPEQLDADRFEQAVSKAMEEHARGDVAAARDLLRYALGLWRGPPLADFTYEDFARDEIDRLEELRLAALEARIEADLAVGRRAEIVPELETLVREHPTRERLRGLLMLALYRSGRQAEALETYRQAQRALDEKLGLEPGPELRELERAILAQDPALAAPARPRRLPATSERRRGGVLVALGGAGLLAAVAAIALFGGEEPRSGLAEANSLVAIDPQSAEVEAAIPTGVGPSEVASEAGSLWVANRADDTVTQIDPSSRSVVSTTSPGTSVDALAAGAGAVWTADRRRARAVRLDPGFRSVRRTVSVAPEASLFPSSSAVAVGQGAVWVANGNAEVVRVDPETNEAVATIEVGNDPSAIATGDGAVWVADRVDNTATRIDSTGANAVTAVVPVGRAPAAIAVGAAGVWVANTGEDTISRIDPDTAAVVAKIEVGRRPTGVAVGAGGVWVANSLSGGVSRIDPETNRVTTTVELGQAPQGVTVSAGFVWVSVQAAPTAPAAPVETPQRDALSVAVAADPGPTDPALLDLDFVRNYATCALLLNYPDSPAPEGASLQPEVARAPPEVSRDGRTYIFRLRSGFRFSPPSREPVTAAAFKRAIDRVLHPKMRSFAAAFMADVADVRARGNSLVVELTDPAPSLPARLATPYFCAVPPGTPIDPEGVDPVPSAGPYYVASHEPNKSLVLRRNPGYAGPRDQQLREIRYTIGVSPERAVRMVERGTVDYVSPPADANTALAPEVDARLERRYGPLSAAARAGRQRYFTSPGLSVFYLLFNTRRPLFADPRMRRAVNFAIDRRALAAHPGLPATARPTDQYIPPGIPGFEDAAIYPLGGPDLATARRLAGRGRRDATLYTCTNPNCARNAQTLRQNLRAIGIELDVRQVPEPVLFRLPGDPRAPYDLITHGYVADYADPFNFINLLFAPGSKLRSPVISLGRAFEARMAATARLTGARRLHAYARLDRDLAAGPAPAAAFANGTVKHFFAPRVGCQFEHPIYGIDLAALCIKDDGGG
jgi:YVTN family beta-propeller protein